MGKTYKDQANYYRFKGSLDDAPEHLREKGELMERHYRVMPVARSSNVVLNEKD